MVASFCLARDLQKSRHAQPIQRRTNYMTGQVLHPNGGEIING